MFSKKWVILSIIIVLLLDFCAPMEHTYLMGKLVTVVELSPFLAQIGKAITSGERDNLIEYLAQNPEMGDVIPRTGGLRKLRWPGKQQGKRGGLRIIYYFHNNTAPVFLITAYSKSTQVNLTAKQEKTLTELAKTLKATCKQK